MGRVNKPLAIVLQPDVPAEAADMLEAMGHLLYTSEQAVTAAITKVDAVVGAKCWRIPETWWLGKDGKLSAHAKMMLSAATTAAYPDAKPKKGKRK